MSLARITKKWVLLITSSLIVVTSQTAIANGDNRDSLIAFSMADQFDREYTAESFSGKIVLFLAGDKDGSAFTGTWGSAIGRALGETVSTDSIAFVPVADLEGVPFFIKGWVKKQFPKNENQWVLLDWDGVFVDAYDFEKGKCNLVVFDRNHRFVRTDAVADLDQQTLDDYVAEITGLLTADTN